MGRLNLKNGAEQSLLDTVVRPVWSVAEQLLGEGTVIWPAGDEGDGLTTGPCFLSDEVVEGLGTHHGKSNHGGIDISDKATAEGGGFDWDGNGSWVWEPELQLPKTGARATCQPSFPLAARWAAFETDVAVAQARSG